MAKRGTTFGHLARLEAKEEQMDGGNRPPGSFALGKSEQKKSEEVWKRLNSTLSNIEEESLVLVLFGLLDKICYQKLLL